MQWRSAQWLPVYLIGLGLIVYLSPYGPHGRDPVIPLWWDIAVVAVFSLVIYYWALAVALPTAEIERMVNEVVPPRRRAWSPCPGGDARRAGRADGSGNVRAAAHPATRDDQAVAGLRSATHAPEQRLPAGGAASRAAQEAP